MNELILQTLNAGADEACIIPASWIPVNPELVKLCKTPGCPDYGRAPGCPPHGLGADGFIRKRDSYSQTLVFRICASEQDLRGKKNLLIMRNLQSLAAHLEKTALQLGYSRAEAFAGGSCKRIFCGQLPSCVVITKGHDCLFPELARPSLSAVGVNMAALMRACNWDEKMIDPHQQPSPQRNAWVAAIVLLQGRASLPLKKLSTSTCADNW